ncbi:CehA/McbA family metallohydrolase [Sphingomonas sp. NSE70-1]|uniref:CehA/McbA family metallohydrolase n=1 Tax=Sphingomonas caseinilyticus TaxID=2908205 RepID=A0ABT0RVG1_9SPHN|nr:CehA/McbA family metallohydrolase [Sphingomonas caseinilyticus]MCL6699012.1 CehA/McbA family metallohydrolase [Sphingomonas caseinilyticus]
MTAPAEAGREPVLKQVDLPHSYYWRELYIPQLTTGPSGASFTPDGTSLVYSMGGSLWHQVIGSDEAIELTHPKGAYDYQPDIAPDGGNVVFTRNDGDALELWRLDLQSGREQRLTSGGAVNVEPRLSPDGKRIAWVSTLGTGHFNLFIADVGPNGLSNARPLIGERQSRIQRYYYSAYDHALNPSWSPDGKRIVFVSNNEVAWGTGDIWSVAVDDPTDRRKILNEETSWSARPEISPDGKQLLFASYHGRQWRQLWLTTPDGSAPLPLTFGEFDRGNARWSPEGERIAYISNERGNTSLVVQQVVGGATVPITASHRRYKAAQAKLTIDIRDEQGRSVPARVAVLGSDGRAAAPDLAWMHADDGFDRARQSSETHYFHCASPCTLDAPAGDTSMWVQRGFRYLPWRQTVKLTAGTDRTLAVKLEANDLPVSFGRWRSADLHVHMNYGGSYRNSPENLARQARAEDLDVVYNLIVNKEERIPDIGYFRTDPDPASGDGVLIIHAQEFHTSFWGHLGLIGLSDHLLTPDFSAYQHTALASPFPDNGMVADLAHAQGALVGYVHPFDWDIDPAKEKSLSNELPADVVHGKVDYIEVVGFSDHKATANIWYRLLNLGFRLPAGAGTDAMANYASLRGPVGMNRVFLETGGDMTPAALKAALKSGRTFASNGPLIGLELDGKRPGDTVSGTSPGKLPYRIALRSPVAVDNLELVHNGKVVKSFSLTGDRRKFDAAGELEVNSGWLLLRAWNDGADPQVLDIYPYATTSPIYLELPGGAPPAPQDASYFAAWMDRVIGAAESRNDYRNERERETILDYLRRARDHYRSLESKGR